MFITIPKSKHTYKHTTIDFNQIVAKNILQQNKTKTFETVTFIVDENTYKTHWTEYCKNILKNFALDFDVKQMLSEDINKHYYSFKIPKATHGFRNIDAPDEALKTVQYKIVNVLKILCRYTHNSAHAYVTGRGTHTALQQHQTANNNWFLKIDLKNFFGSCTNEFIYQQLIKISPFTLLKNDPECDIIIHDMIKLCCLNNVLPQGTPVSPMLTNLLMIPIDYRLNSIAPVYTRYADDLLFSWYTKPKIQTVLKTLHEIFKDTPLKINYEKTRLGSKSGRNWNLGLMLNSLNQITIGHKKKQQFRAMIDQFLYDPSKYTQSQKQKLAGTLSYYKHIEPEYIDYVVTKYNTKHNANLKELLK